MSKMWKLPFQGAGRGTLAESFSSGESGPPWWKSLEVQMLPVMEESFISFSKLENEAPRSPLVFLGMTGQVSLLCL